MGKATGKISLDATGSRRVFFPIWYNTYLSPKMYKEFHWSYTKRNINELVDAGFTSLVFYEGHHEPKLEMIRELPKGKTIAYFEKTDLRKVKEVLGDHMCIMGGLPASLLVGGTPDEAKPENVKAMVEAVMSLVGTKTVVLGSTLDQFFRATRLFSGQGKGAFN